MKKMLLILVVLLIAVPAASAPLTTRIPAAYKLIDTQEGNEPTFGDANFVPISRDANSYDVDLLTLDGGGGETKVNAAEFIIASDANDGNTAVVEIWASANWGPWELLCSNALTVGTAQSITDYRWFDTATVTSYHLATVSAYDSGNNRAAKIKISDLTGYQFLKIIVRTTDSPAKTIKTYMRWW